MVLFYDNIKQRIMTAMFINVTFWAKMQSLEKISSTILENLDIFWFHIWYFVFLFVFFIFLLWHWSCSEVRICVPSNVTVTAAELTKDAAGCAAASQNEVKCDAGEVVWPPLLLLLLLLLLLRSHNHNATQPTPPTKDDNDALESSGEGWWCKTDHVCLNANLLPSSLTLD